MNKWDRLAMEARDLRFKCLEDRVRILEALYEVHILQAQIERDRQGIANTMRQIREARGE